MLSHCAEIPVPRSIFLLEEWSQATVMLGMTKLLFMLTVSIILDQQVIIIAVQI